MKFCKLNKFGGVIAAIIFVAATNVNAAIIDIAYTANWDIDNVVSAGQQAVPGSIRTNTLSDNVFLDGFNSSLGTLQDVNISFISDWYLTHWVSGEDPETGLFEEDNIHAWGDASQTLSVDLFSPVGTELTQSSTQHAECSDDDGACSQNIGGPGVFNGSLAFLSLSDFIDVSSVQLNLANTLTGTSYNDDFEDLHWFTARNSWDGIATITYTYDDGQDPASSPVPEPTTVLLFGTGLAGLAGARFRRNKK